MVKGAGGEYYKNLTPEIAELIGIILGDGCISPSGHNEVAITGDLEEEQEYYNNHVVPLFNRTIAIPLLRKEIKPRAYPSVGVYGIYVFNKKLIKYLTVTMKLNIKGSVNEIPMEIMKIQKPEIWKALLRGLFDTDGSVYFDKIRGINKRPKIKFSTASRNLLKQVIDLGNRLGFHFYVNKPYKGKRDKNYNYAIELQRKTEIQRWFREIGFNNSKHRTKYLFWKLFGFYIPRSTIKQRKELINSILLRNLRPQGL